VEIYAFILYNQLKIKLLLTYLIFLVYNLLFFGYPHCYLDLIKIININHTVEHSKVYAQP